MDTWKIKETSVDSVVTALKQGKVIVCPTDTVYGLVADATNKEAVKRIFTIKGRELGKAFPVFVRDIEMAMELGVVDSSQQSFMKKYWPGKVTVIVKSRGVLPDITGTTEKIGMRIPEYPFLQEILKKVDVPLIGTSANISGLPALSLVNEIYSQFTEREYTPDILIDGGDLPSSLSSSVIDITNKDYETLRQGAVTV
ncbi:MAG TPA: threonylcarbamoyl-AMP synthase [Candidatus Wildermuthbacteria bacterium]|nr:threonylcarbamoyl-AMP synthase [Candidatus Wildermuthbacteria bacterium]